MPTLGMPFAVASLPLAAFDLATFGAGVFCLAFGVLLWTPSFARLLTQRVDEPGRGPFPLAPRSPLGVRVLGTVLIVLGVGGMGAGFAA